MTADDGRAVHPAPWGRPVVVTLSWDQGGLPRCETYGPWQSREDDAHLAAIQDFLRRWRKLTGAVPSVAVIAVINDPETWLSDLAERIAAVPPREADRAPGG